VPTLFLASHLDYLERQNKAEHCGMKRGGNPRRDALEYGVLLTVATSMTVVFGIFAYIRCTEDPSNRQRLDLHAPVNFGQAWRELQRYSRDGSDRGGHDAGSK
jgi:hypothetical protein